MDKLGCTLVRVLANRFHGANLSSFCRYLPEEEANTVAALDVDSDDPSFAWRPPAKWLERIHYSWLAPAVSSFPASWQPSLLASLTPQQGSCLREMLHIDEEIKDLPTAPARRYLLRLLFDKMELQNAPPLEFIPEGPFSPLAKWDKNQLLTLIDFLSMYDLKEKIRFIVDPKRLREIYASLDKERLEFLRYTMPQRERITASDLKLEGWHGDKKELDRILHHRGLVRLGTALSGQSPVLLWHITHVLDTGRSAILTRYCKAGAPPHIIQVLAQQVSSLIEYIQTAKKS